MGLRSLESEKVHDGGGPKIDGLSSAAGFFRRSNRNPKKWISVAAIFLDRGRDDNVAPPSEPDVRISRIRLSSRWLTS
jgi:hypothetical protein